MLNVELMERTMTYIRDHPEEWDQKTFVSACGTTHCFAGTALRLSGETVLYGDGLVSGKQAELLLGLTSGQACEVFYNFTADVDELALVVKDVINESQAENV